MASMDTVNEDAARAPVAEAGVQPENTQNSDNALKRTTTFSHKHIEAPRYIRSQTLGLARASSVNSPTRVQFGSNATEQRGAPTGVSAHTSPSIKKARRTSVPFPETAPTSPELLPSAATRRGRRTSTLGLVFEPAHHTQDSHDKQDEPRNKHTRQPDGEMQHDRKLKSLLFEYGEPGDIAELPSDPKTWTPSQLSVYLSHMLKLTPKRVVADMMRFVVQRGLTGKRFLRLRNQDLIEMGINISWCRVLSTARERLRRECLRGRIFGFAVEMPSTISTQMPTSASDGALVHRRSPSGQDDAQAGAEEGGDEDEDIESLFLKLPRSQSTSGHQEWNKNSWRRTEGKKSRGRVKGIAKAFEKGDSDENRRAMRLTGLDELEEVARMRRDRQTSADSVGSARSASSSGTEGPISPTRVRHGITRSTSSPVYATFDRPSEFGEVAQKTDTQNVLPLVNEPALSEPEDSESEVEGSDKPVNVNWADVEPLPLEEMGSLPLDFMASPATTPTVGMFQSAAVGEATLERYDSSEPPEIKSDEEISKLPRHYQDDVEAQGEDAYAAIRIRKPSEASVASEELSDEHLAYWRHADIAPLPGGLIAAQPDRSPASTLSRSASMPLPARLHLQDGAFEHVVDDANEYAGEIEAGVSPDPGMIMFAELDDNVITMKKQVKRTLSVDDFGSIKFGTVRSSLGRDTGKTSLAGLFSTENEGSATNDAASHSRGKYSKGKKSARRLSTLFAEDANDDRFCSLKSRNGSVVVLPRAEVEAMQARLHDLEQQLEIAKSSSSSNFSPRSPGSPVNATVSGTSTGRHTAERARAMSEWVRGALGEVRDVVTSEKEDTTWLGLGGWALAAGLGIGIVVGEAVISKLRR